MPASSLGRLSPHGRATEARSLFGALPRPQPGYAASAGPGGHARERRKRPRPPLHRVLVAVGDVGDAPVDAFAAAGGHVVAFILHADLGRMRLFFLAGVRRGVRGFLVSHRLVSWLLGPPRAEPLAVLQLWHTDNAVSPNPSDTRGSDEGPQALSAPGTSGRAFRGRRRCPRGRPGSGW